MEKYALREDQPLSTSPNESGEVSDSKINMEEVAMNPKQAKKIVMAVYVLLLVLGVATGYILAKTSGNTVANSQRPGSVVSGKVAGITDTRTFKDSAEGVIEKGGLNGEGTHKLIRDGGPSQTVYLISSAVDLDEYAGKKVKIWGQTMAAKKVAWLMDVGKIELQ